MICSECGQDFSEGKPSPAAALGLHMYRAHGIRSQAGGKKGAPRRRQGKPRTGARAPAAAAAPAPEPTSLFEPEPELILPKKKRFWDGWLSTKERVPGEIRPAKVGRPRREKRTSFATGGTLAWMAGSQIATSMGSVPVGRAMQIQSGIAGEVLDSAVAGTRLDKIVQPFIGDTERFRDVGMLVAFPLLVGVCDAQPGNALTASLLEIVVRQNLHALAEGVKRMRAEDRRLADTVETLTGIGMDLGENPVHTILSMIFAPVEPTQQSSPAGAAPAATAPGAAPPAPPAPPGPPTANGQAPMVEPLPFGAVIVTPADVPPGL